MTTAHRSLGLHCRMLSNGVIDKPTRCNELEEVVSYLHQFLLMMLLSVLASISKGLFSDVQNAPPFQLLVCQSIADSTSASVAGSIFRAQVPSTVLSSSFTGIGDGEPCATSSVVALDVNPQQLCQMGKFSLSYRVYLVRIDLSQLSCRIFLF